jgi:catechol 2,3-dioxygenase-like lactoylglutathione lyase family enzyme
VKLNHLDLQARDVSRSAAFFERYFGLCVRSNPGSPALVILTDESGFVLVLQRAKSDERYPEGFHLGFLLEQVADVHAVHARARADGTPVSDVIVNGRGTMIYVTAPDGYYVEVSCQNHRFAPAPALGVGSITPRSPFCEFTGKTFPAPPVGGDS